MKRVSRIGDMGEGTKLLVIKEDDGDVIVSVLPESHVIPQYAVQFCTYSGGGRSQRTLKALWALIGAIEADNAELECKNGETKV